MYHCVKMSAMPTEWSDPPSDGVTDGCEPPDLGPLQEQARLLMAELSLQPILGDRLAITAPPVITITLPYLLE